MHRADRRPIAASVSFLSDQLWRELWRSGLCFSIMPTQNGEASLGYSKQTVLVGEVVMWALTMPAYLVRANRPTQTGLNTSHTTQETGMHSRSCWGSLPNIRIGVWRIPKQKALVIIYPHVFPNPNDYFFTVRERCAKIVPSVVHFVPYLALNCAYLYLKIHSNIVICFLKFKVLLWIF